ncbi:MAG TPA: DUF5719 family protein [Acidimicrobiales bacterium]|nr:DUF5719 family protein [Acidimicrobiales bacterium]
MLVVVACALVVLGVVSARTSAAVPGPVATSVATVQVGTESSASFCGGLEHDPGVATSVVAIADLAHVARTAEVTTSNERGRVAQRLVAVRPGHVVHLDPSHLLKGSVEAMSIVAEGGGLAATESVSGPGGTAVAPCLTGGGPSWYLTGGSTEREHSLLVSILNPYATSAQVTVSFLTGSGFVEPSAYKGLDLGPHRLDVLDVHDVAPNEAPITTEVATTSGNVVVFAVNRSSTGTGSVSLVPGAPAPASSATFPLVPNHHGASTRLVLANPGPTSVNASVRIDWSPGCARHCAAPLGVTVAPGATTSLLVAPSSRAPIGVAAAAALTASPPGLVVVQNVRTTSSRGQSAALDDPSGLGADQLVLVDPTGSGFERVSITNSGEASVAVTFESNGPNGVRIGRTVQVAAHGVTFVNGRRLGRLVGGVLLLVATGPIFAAGEVRDALLGSDLLVAAPVG